jgi:hypothetical protein
LIDGFPTDSSRKLLQILSVLSASEETNTRAAILGGTGNGLSFANDNVCTPMTGRASYRKCVGFNHGDDEQGATSMTLVG